MLKLQNVMSSEAIVFTMKDWHMLVELCHMASDNLINIGADNGLLPIKDLAITWIKALIFVNWGTCFNQRLFINQVFWKHFTYEDIVQKVLMILFRPQCVNIHYGNNIG